MAAILDYRTIALNCLVSSAGKVTTFETLCLLDTESVYAYLHIVGGPGFELYVPAAGPINALQSRKCYHVPGSGKGRFFVGWQKNSISMS